LQGVKKVKYYYNPSTLRFERIERSFRTWALRAFGFLCATLFSAGLIVFAAFSFLDSPKDRFLKQEIARLRLEYDLMERELDTLSYVLEKLQERDNNIYRVIFEAEPVSPGMRMSGIGGSERFKRLNNYENGQIIKRNLLQIELLKRQLVSQSKSYDEIARLIEEKEDMLQHIPAIQPIANDDLTRIASGFGMRIHPIYKTQKMHEGLDFSASTGTPVHATGNGVVTKVEFEQGYGNMVEVAHGYGYRTRYAHLKSFKCRVGQRVKRGGVIGLVGNTGTSTAPHLHYEVLKDGAKVDPINFFYNDLTDEEYATVIQLANKANQSFD
jgi:murein DD-endopeptidase MepM/ murein hydrolase activator NlpD